jgi:4a-hydroxytetrahydrobiopterin dehydratase
VTYAKGREAGVTLLDQDEIVRLLEGMSGWELRDRALEKTFTFDDYLGGIGFVNRLAAVAEDQGHHPDLEVGYGSVVVRISTHSEGGVTEKDFRLAAAADGERGTERSRT